MVTRATAAVTGRARLDEWAVLTVLSDNVGHPMSQVAELTHIAPPTMTKLVDRMVASSLVSRRTDPVDRRRVLIFSTARGRQRHRRLQSLIDAALTDLDPKPRERVALRVIAWSFFALAAYVAVEAVRGLLGAGEAERSPVGIVLVAVSVLVMPFLSFAQRRAGRELGSATAVADSQQTLLCTYLSAAVLVGLVLNAALGWWWADPVAGLVLAVLAVREGRNAWRGDLCCAPAAMPQPNEASAGCSDGCCSS